MREKGYRAVSPIGVWQVMKVTPAEPVSGHDDAGF